ncbi:MAG TPA: hypothetical protein VJ837_00200 [Candidatus Paceibacterota bacterium]|nr:hypothetical protein [Candidatus Paceibacterota bacterium]
MYALIIAFATSLFLIAVFFALKEREAHSGRETRLTRFLRRHSPTAHAAAVRVGAKSISYLRSALSRITNVYARGARYVLRIGRAFVVIIAERMIHAVRGEKLLSMRSASSMYLKHLKEHKDGLEHSE